MPILTENVTTKINFDYTSTCMPVLDMCTLTNINTLTKIFYEYIQTTYIGKDYSRPPTYPEIADFFNKNNPEKIGGKEFFKRLKQVKLLSDEGLYPFMKFTPDYDHHETSFIHQRAWQVFSQELFLWLLEMDNSHTAFKSLSLSNVDSQLYFHLARAIIRKGSDFSLELTRCKIDKCLDLLKSAIQQSTRLKKLGLPWNRLSTDTVSPVLDALLENTSVTELDLRYNHLYGSGTVFYDFLRKNPALRSLDVGHSGLSSEDIEAIIMGLRGNSSLESLILDDATFNQSTSEILAVVLRMNNTLKSLDFSHIRFKGTDGAKAIFKALKVNQGLTHLKIYLDTLAEGNLNTLAQSLIQNRTLLSLNIDGFERNISKQDAQDIVTILKTNQSLTSLKMESFSSDDEGIEEILEALCLNKTLESFELCKYRPVLSEGIYQTISDRMAEIIARLLRENNTLTEIKIPLCKISINGIHIISEALQSNSTLKTLKLARDFSLQVIIENALKKNQDACVQETSGSTHDIDKLTSFAASSVAPVVAKPVRYFPKASFFSVQSDGARQGPGLDAYQSLGHGNNQGEMNT